MTNVRKVLVLVVVLSAASLTLAEPSYVRDFTSDGTVCVGGYLDGTSVSIYSAGIDTLKLVKELKVDRDQTVTLALPGGKYVAESNQPIRVTGEPVNRAAQAQPVLDEPSSDPVVSEGEPVVYAVPWRGTSPHEI